jgi:hypothetical protein
MAIIASVTPTTAMIKHVFSNQFFAMSKPIFTAGRFCARNGEERGSWNKFWFSSGNFTYKKECHQSLINAVEVVMSEPHSNLEAAL